jgi:hypothetical protein
MVPRPSVLVTRFTATNVRDRTRHPRSVLLDCMDAGLNPKQHQPSTMNSATALMTSHTCWPQPQQPCDPITSSMSTLFTDTSSAKICSKSIIVQAYWPVPLPTTVAREARLLEGEHRAQILASAVLPTTVLHSLDAVSPPCPSNKVTTAGATNAMECRTSQCDASLPTAVSCESVVSNPHLWKWKCQHPVATCSQPRGVLGGVLVCCDKQHACTIRPPKRLPMKERRRPTCPLGTLVALAMRLPIRTPPSAVLSE